MPTPGTTDVASLLAIDGPAKRERLGEAAEGMRLEMEALSLQVRDLIIAQPPGEDNPLQVWLCRAGAEPSRTEVADQGQIGCLAVGASKMTVLTLSYREPGRISHVACADISGPTILQTNYASLREEASKQRRRMTDLRKPTKGQPAKR
jgi:hypothetical protein